ncbi:MAG TPA: SDR family NAD(P)-dependent oxidoreductase, partial [Propylenella sp.]|nr:SDR family NAD(P)-dependent oxidoreductase [Propylenella sp.]
MFDPASLLLQGRRALVTGGAAGIGAAIAQAFAACGADVAISVHRRGGEATLAAIRKLQRNGEAIEADLEGLTAETAAELVDEAERRLGPIDILVNNAGIIRRAEALDHSEEDWRAVMAVDLDAVWLLS